MQLRTRPVDALSSGDHDGINMRLPGRPQGGGPLWWALQRSARKPAAQNQDRGGLWEGAWWREGLLRWGSVLCLLKDLFPFRNYFIILIVYFYFLAVPRGMWDLSSPTRDWTCTPSRAEWTLNQWTAREVPHSTPWWGCTEHVSKPIEPWPWNCAFNCQRLPSQLKKMETQSQNLEPQWLQWDSSGKWDSAYMFLCFILQDIKKLLQCRTQIKGCTTPTKHEIFQAWSRPGIPEPPVQPCTVDSCCDHGFSGGKVETGTSCLSAWRPSIPACPGRAVLQLNSDTPQEHLPWPHANSGRWPALTTASAVKRLWHAHLRMRSRRRHGRGVCGLTKFTWNWIPAVMVSGGGAFGASMMGWVAHQRDEGARACSSPPSPPCTPILWGHREKAAVCKPGREPSPDISAAGALILDHVKETEGAQAAQTVVYWYHSSLDYGRRHEVLTGTKALSMVPGS